MRILDFDNDNIIITPEILTVPEFKAVWSRDKSRSKNTAFTQLSYIYHICDYNSPYANIEESRKKEYVGLDILKDSKYEPDDIMIRAIGKYKELSQTPKERLLNAAKAKLDELAQFLKDAKVGTDNVKAVLEVYKQLAASASSFDALEEAVKKERVEGEKIRGNKKLSLFSE
jgi:hypothetical protein